MDKVRQFAIEIQMRTGYHAVLRKTKSSMDDNIDLLYVDIRQAKQSYVFLLNDFMCEVQIHKEAF